MYGDINTTNTVNPGTVSINSSALIILLVIFAFVIVVQWKVYTKAGRAGWKSLIPIYNLYVLFEIAGMNGWMFLLMFVPIVGWIIPFVLYYKLGQSFGKSTGFCIGLMLLTPIFLIILAFDSSDYMLGSERSTDYNPNPSFGINQNPGNNFNNNPGDMTGISAGNEQSNNASLGDANTNQNAEETFDIAQTPGMEQNPNSVDQNPNPNVNSQINPENNNGQNM